VQLPSLISTRTLTPRSMHRYALEQKVAELAADGGQVHGVSGQPVKQIAKFPGGKMPVSGAEDSYGVDGELIVVIREGVAEQLKQVSDSKRELSAGFQVRQQPVGDQIRVAAICADPANVGSIACTPPGASPVGVGAPVLR
jgi:hypothetical protein